MGGLRGSGAGGLLAEAGACLRLGLGWRSLGLGRATLGLAVETELMIYNFSK